MTRRVIARNEVTKQSQVQTIENLKKELSLLKKELEETKWGSEKTNQEIKILYGELKQKAKALDNLNRELEEKVEERTKKLSQAKDELETQVWALDKTKDGISVLYKQLEEKNRELQKLDQLKTDFVSTVSHELRTPLSITKEGISIVLDKIAGAINEKQEKMLRMASSNVDRLSGLINDLLDISKIEAGKMELKRILVDLNNLVDGICSKWKLECDKKQQALKVSLHKGPNNIYIDPDKMIQVLTNLISNAIKYTPEKGSIDVKLKDKEGETEISVSDNGMGIAKEDLPKVFGKFQQFDRHPGAGTKGTGLGLAICRQLVEMHNGRIAVKSKPNEGSTFTVSLPKMDVEEIFKEYINNGIKEAADKNAPLSLVVIHIAGFDELQKELGCEKTHDLLKSIEKVTKSSLRRQADTVVRNTGELIVLLFDTKREHAEPVKKRIEEVISGFLSKGKERWLKKVRITIGSATYPDDAASDGDLLDKARPKRSRR